MLPVGQVGKAILKGDILWQRQQSKKKLLCSTRRHNAEIQDNGIYEHKKCDGLKMEMEKS